MFLCVEARFSQIQSHLFDITCNNIFDGQAKYILKSKQCHEIKLGQSIWTVVTDGSTGAITLIPSCICR